MRDVIGCEDVEINELHFESWFTNWEQTAL